MRLLKFPEYYEGHEFEYDGENFVAGSNQEAIVMVYSKNNCKRLCQQRMDLYAESMEQNIDFEVELFGKKLKRIN